MPDSSSRSAVGTPKMATLSIHGDFLEKALPQWLLDATPDRRLALKKTATQLPQWYKNASPEQLKTINASVKASAIAQNQLDKTMATFQDVDTFARPLLVKALKDRFQVDVDVDKTFLCLRRALTVSVFNVDVSSYELLKLPMLQAALHNFEEWECRVGSYHASSGFLVQASSPDTYEPASVNLTVSQFLSLCRSLDIGAKYQTYLTSFFNPADVGAPANLREHFIASQKATMKAAADQALLTKDIEPQDHAMILSVINGNNHPSIGTKPVWFDDMSLMGKRMTGCVSFVICEKYRYCNETILYIPHDPAHPFKRYTSSQRNQTFKRLFTDRAGLPDGDPSPTPYQLFFSQFVAYEHRPYYFSQFVQTAADAPKQFLNSPARKVVEVLLDTVTPKPINELPPGPPTKKEPAPDPYIAPSSVRYKGADGIWSANVDLWDYLYEQHRDKVLADARAHAVPTHDVDVKAREAKLASLMELGMLGLNLISMFVPVLGEIMMVVMAGQLLYETLEGSIEWAEGDKHAAKEHLIDVAENLVQLGVMAGVGAAVSKFRAVKPEPVIENLSPVTLPNGEARLWKPDLSGYESTVALDAAAPANELGQYTLDGKIYFRQGGKVYEQFFDGTIKKWRIKHPTQTEAYQPILHSNGRGSWRHSLERPLEWDRLTLLRRMGHETEPFSDAELIKVADVSGISDNALRKMHMDLAAPPPELLDAMRLFKADADSGQVIEQIRGSQPIDDRYLFVLPLVVEMPRWPTGQVLEVFEKADFSGRSVKYGSRRALRGATAKAPIRITRDDLLAGRLPTIILAALDEPQVTRLLRREGAQVLDLRPQAFRDQLAAYAQTRKSVIFDSLYAGSESVDEPIKLLQRACPGLSEAAARETLAHVAPDDLERMSATRRVPLAVLEEARWYALQGRQVRAYAGLRSETIASADSRRLALHTLENLPGWRNTLRLEVREGSTSGPLLDSIGTDTAPDRKYLVKNGPSFQAFNDSGEALNSVSPEGDNFYASLMHAMPDDVRRGLGVPNVGQHALLQEKIIEFTDLNRSETSQLLAPQRKWFKPPVRVTDTLVGYYASGRGEGGIMSLESQAQHLYGLNEAQATDYISRLRTEHKTSKDVFNYLQKRESEYNELASTLDEWARPQGSTATDDYRTQMAQQLKDAWRKEPLAEKEDAAACLHMSVGERLPPLTVDFPHVRELKLTGRSMDDASMEVFLARFPNLQTLSIESGSTPQLRYLTSTAGRSSLTKLPSAVTRMARLKRLTFSTAADQLAPEFSSSFNTLTSLEELHIEYRGHSSAALNGLDLSALVQLKQLRIDASLGLTAWPANLENLPALERVDLTRTAISELPATLYSGHDRLWSGLSMDWSRFSRKSFKPAYDFVRQYRGELGHLVDLHQMVSDYTVGELSWLIHDQNVANRLNSEIRNTVHAPEARFAAIEEISDQYNDIFARFYVSFTSTARSMGLRAASWTTWPNGQVISVLETNWWAAVAERYGLPSPASELELPGQPPLMAVVPAQVSTVELPPLPAASFAHVRTLRMGWVGNTTEQTRGFIRAFSKTQTLELNGHGLTEIPASASEHPDLTRLDLSNNNLLMPALQAQLNEFSNLEVLDLSQNSNPLTDVDVSALTKLRSLNMRGTQLPTWPAGAESLPQLEWLDLRDNRLTTLPPQVLANDELLMKTNLAGNPFSPTAMVELQAARQRVEAARGLPQGALDRFERQAVADVFPPQETGLTMARYLLPLPQPIVMIEGAEGFVRRVQRLAPNVTEEKALQWFERLREGGMGDAQINTHLATWEQHYETLIRELNGWLYTPELQGQNMSRVADQRRLVARTVAECWQAGVSAESGYGLSLRGLQVDNLPELNVPFEHVLSLDLTGVRFSASSADGFLSSFPALRRLALGGNQLAAVPEAVGRMALLEDVDLAANAITDSQSLYSRLGAGLRRLDLHTNALAEFSADTFPLLETLDLSYNRLRHWPDGTLEARHLRTLDLAGNEITAFADDLLDGTHEVLVGGTDLSSNNLLSRDSFEELRDYSDLHQGGAVMGWGRDAIDDWIEGFETDVDDSDSDGSDHDVGAAYEPLEVILDPQLDTREEMLEVWLLHSPSDLVASRRQLWKQLAEEPGHEGFFRLLERLRDTDEYRYSPADLTRRVWNVMDAAASSEQLRGPLFVAALTHGTCIDGRILTFSSLEVLVYEANALRNVPAHDLTLKGQRLVELSRQLFRLDKVDTLAELNASNQDRAEVRLQYRIGMTDGWPDGLKLPGQPRHMAFGRPISGTVLTGARDAVLQAEASDEFYESLINREYWREYLQERYPDEFQALQRKIQVDYEALEDEYADRVPGTDSQERYDAAVTMLDVDRKRTEAQFWLDLSRRVVLESTPRAASPQPGPSTRQ